MVKMTNKLKAGTHYVCETNDDEIAVLAYKGNGKFECGQTVDDIKVIHKVVPNPLDLMNPESFYENITNLPLYIEWKKSMSQAMLSGKKEVFFSTRRSKDTGENQMFFDIENRLLTDLAEQGWNATSSVSNEFRLSLWWRKVTITWTDKKIGFFEKIFSSNYKTPKQPRNTSFPCTKGSF